MLSNTMTGGKERGLPADAHYSSACTVCYREDSNASQLCGLPCLLQLHDHIDEV